MGANFSSLTDNVKKSDLIDYAKTADLSNYAKNTDLKNLAALAALKSDLTSLAKTTDLTPFAKSSELPNKTVWCDTDSCKLPGSTSVMMLDKSGNKVYSKDNKVIISGVENTTLYAGGTEVFWINKHGANVVPSTLVVGGTDILPEINKKLNTNNDNETRMKINGNDVFWINKDGANVVPSTLVVGGRNVLQELDALSAGNVLDKSGISYTNYSNNFTGIIADNLSLRTPGFGPYKVNFFDKSGCLDGKMLNQGESSMGINSCSNDESQAWVYNPVKGQVRNVGANKCLDIGGQNGQWYLEVCKDIANQQFRLTEDGLLRGYGRDNQCLDIGNSNRKANCDGNNPNQRFKFDNY